MNHLRKKRKLQMEVPERAAIATAILLVLCVSLLATSCAPKKRPEPAPVPGPVGSAASYPMTVTDSMGRKVVLPKKPQRFVSLVPSNTEILFDLGLGGSIAGVTKYCDYPEAAKKIENVGGYSNPSMEKIISLKPDLVLAGDAHQTVVEQLDKLGIPTVVVVAKRLQDIPETVVLIGDATGAPERGRQIRDSMLSRINAVSEKVKATSERPDVYYELWHEPLTTVGPGSFLHDLIGLAGGVNIIGDAKQAYPVISAETVISRNPQYILFGHGGQRADELKKRPGWANVNAIKLGKVVHFEDENIFMRAGPRIVEALETLARTMHPELFK